jgi:MFS family permease
MGRFQYFTSIVLILSMNSVGYLLYGLGYLLLYPRVKCFKDGMELTDPKDIKFMCQPQYFCNAQNGVIFETVTENQFSLDNWMVKYDMVCASPLMISSFSMVYFLGWTFGSLFLPQWSDLKGRRLPMILINVVNILCLIIIALLPGGSEKEAYPLIGLFFVLGIFTAGRTTVGYCYMCEMIPQKYQVTVGSLFNVSEAFIYIYLTVYYMHYKNWEPTLWFAIGMLVLMTLGLVIIPESPKWLYSQGRYT